MGRSFVVTGCARSGTMYTATLLTALGIPCGHEAVFTPGSPARPENAAVLLARNGRYDGDSSWLAAPFVRHLAPGTVVLHQVRHPLAVIRSHLGFRFFSPESERNGFASYLAFIRRWCPAVMEPAGEEPAGEARRCVLYWELWNRLVARGASEQPGITYHRYRLEDLDASALRTIVSLLDVRRARTAVEGALEQVSRSTNTWGPTDRRLTWTALPPGKETESAADLAREYGYVPDVLS